MDLRPAEPADAAQIAAIYAPFVRESHTSFELDAPDVAEMAARIEGTTATHPWLVCASGGEVLGYAYAASHRARAAYQWCAETTVYIHPQGRRSGIGRRLYQALLATLALQGFRVAYAGIALPNPGSVGLHEALGFTPIGVYTATGFKLGRWRDVMWLERALGELDANPAPPLPFTQARETEAFRRLLG